MALFDDASLVTTPNGYKAGTLYSIKPTSGAGDMTVVRATTARRVNSAGLIESVANNVPRLDYSNGTCPSILVEPQRTNLLTYSEQFDNAAWTKNELTITANNAISPDGTQNADTAFETSVNAYHDLLQFPSVTSGTTYTLSSFVKAAGRDYCYLFFSDGTTPAAVKYNLATGVVLGTALGSPVSSKIENYGNGWYRCSLVYTSGATATATLAISATNSPALSLAPYAGDVTKGISVWGAQAEAGSYPTSYIPTTSAAVTRNADVISKTGISALIGQTEGVLFLDLYASAKNDDTNTFATWLVAGNATNNFQIYNLGTTLYWLARNTAGVILDQSADQTIVEGTRYKIAYAYKSGDYALYINGVQKRTNANANVPAVSQFNLSSGGFGASPAIVKNEYNSAVLFPTRLTNAELISLTTL
jgi:hypothetical protein